MFYLQVVIVNEQGEQQNDADITEFDTLEQAYAAQAKASEAAQECEPDRV